MRLAPGRLLGPYEITTNLGAGGMGEVYRARDTRLERTVAIKVLSRLSSDPARRQRFEREARAISCLNHPNICTLHDIGHQDGIDYLVMECVEGETLAERLEKGPLPLEQVLKFGVQIADALDKAHRARIVHRDLKPGNIMLSAAGAKLLDFGLAKPVSVLTDVLLTTTKAAAPITGEGTIVGTFQYMSPEQVEGRELDGRSDIFSLGAVLYEAVTGRRAFEGKSQISVISSILEKDPPPITTIKPLTPALLDHAIRTCLAKDPEERWQSARDLSRELKWMSEAGSQASAPDVAGRSSRTMLERVGWGAAVLLFATLAIASFRRSAPATATVRSTILPPEGHHFRTSVNDAVGTNVNASAPAVSPDGRLLVSPVRDSQGRMVLWVRSLNDGGEGKILKGAEGGTDPFWSPDGRSIGFFADGKLKRIDSDGSSLQTLCDAVGGRGGAWSPNGTILFAPMGFAPLYAIPAYGGTPRQITRMSTDGRATSHRWPVFLPDGRHFLYLAKSVSAPENVGIYAGSLDSQDDHMVVRTAQGPAFEADGTIVYVRDGEVVAQPFDEGKMVTTGEPTVLPDRVAFVARASRALFSASRSGMLVYYPAGPDGANELRWYERDGGRGEMLDTSYAAGGVVTPALSPDGAHAIVTVDSADGLNSNLWSYDLVRGTKTRLTTGTGYKQNPVWQPDGRYLFFGSGLVGAAHIARITSEGTGAMEMIHETPGVSENPSSICSDGRYLAYMRTEPGSQPEVWILPLTGERKPFALVQSTFSILARFSPDCKWVAYTSNETGQFEDYLTHFPDAARKYRVSTQGGWSGQWRGDGREFFYYSPGENSMMAVSVEEKGEEISLGAPKALFRLPSDATTFGFAVTANGRRFLISEPNSLQSTVPLMLVTNWQAELKK